MFYPLMNHCLPYYHLSFGWLCSCGVIGGRITSRQFLSYRSTAEPLLSSQTPRGLLFISAESPLSFPRSIEASRKQCVLVFCLSL